MAVQGRRVDHSRLPPCNLVSLLDVSGSMHFPNKLPLSETIFGAVGAAEMRPQDRVAIVVYAGAAGVVLPSTPGDQKARIQEALPIELRAGGSTAGAAGIQLAYNVASENFIAGGNNRIILATDGDFNVGVSSDGALKELISRYRNRSIFLSVLGFGTGNYQDDMNA